MDLKKYWWIIFIVLFLILITDNKKIESNDELLIPTNEFDYNTKIVKDAISSIRGKTEMDKLKNTLSYISNNIYYSYDISIEECYQETASSVLERGTGDCVSKSRLAVAMLRGQGIQSKTAGGCIKEMYTCSPIMTLITPSYIPQRPKNITDIKKRGYLHEWIEVIINGNTYLVDPTSNAIFLKNCNDYKIYSYDNNQYDRCVINDKSFVYECYDW